MFGVKIKYNFRGLGRRLGSSCRRARFHSQHPYGNSQPSITAVPEDPYPLLTSKSTKHESGIHTCAGKTFTQKIKKVNTTSAKIDQSSSVHRKIKINKKPCTYRQVSQYSQLAVAKELSKLPGSTLINDAFLLFWVFEGKIVLCFPHWPQT